MVLARDNVRYKYVAWLGYDLHRASQWNVLHQSIQQHWRLLVYRLWQRCRNDHGYAHCSGKSNERFTAVWHHHDHAQWQPSRRCDLVLARNVLWNEHVPWLRLNV